MLIRLNCAAGCQVEKAGLAAFNLSGFERLKVFCSAILAFCVQKVLLFRAPITHYICIWRRLRFSILQLIVIVLLWTSIVTLVERVLSASHRYVCGQENFKYLYIN